MRYAILILLIFAPALSAQVTLDPPAVELDRTDARALLFLVRQNFSEQADRDGDDVVSPAEAKAWIEGKASETIKTFTKDARTLVAERNPEELDAARKQIRDDYVAAKEAYERMLRGEAQ